MDEVNRELRFFIGNLMMENIAKTVQLNNALERLAELEPQPKKPDEQAK